MCGIAGILAPGEARGALEYLATNMADRLIHRGPDAGGIWAENGVALSHRRLSIVDLSQAGSQPMMSACGRYVIVFNGEIYNHLELRRDLADLKWRGHSDTETLLAAITSWGVKETLCRSAGMFAIALWDRRDRELVLARDRMGEKPLYWGWVGGNVVFSSELKAMKAHSAFSREICANALVEYLSRGYVPAPRSIHPGIFKLEPGCLLEIKAEDFPAKAPDRPMRPGDSHRGAMIKRYWSLDAAMDAGASEPYVDSEQAINQVSKTLAKSVKQQMMADVPLGAFLSGGIDSSLIVALMQSQTSRRVQTFTVGFENTDFDESPFATAVANHLGTEHVTLNVSEAEARDCIPLLPDLYDEPFADSSQIPTHLICRAAKTAVTVALSGDGGDELFGGYNRYVLGPRIWRRIAPMPFPMRKYLGKAALSVPEGVWNATGQVYNSLRPPAAGVSAFGQKVHRIAERLSRVRTLDELYFDTTALWPDSERLTNSKTSATPIGPLHDPLPTCLEDDPAGRMMALDMRSYLPDDILCKVDRAAMGISLETRAPFLAPNVVELSARINTEMKISDGQGKWILRQILYQYVPRELVDRPKTGFSIPLGVWLRGPLRGWAEDLLSPENLSKDGLLAVDPIRASWVDHLSGKVDRSSQLWIVLMFLAWRQHQP